MDKIAEVLSRGVDKIYSSKEALEKVLRSGKKLRLYQGFDPTGDKLHLGHLTGLMKLRQFQQLGHEVIFLIGDGTGQAGDPSGKTKAREKFYSKEELRKNAKDYAMQAGKIVSFSGTNPAKILYNSDWLNKLTLVEILDIYQHFSLQQLEERDLYVERKKKGEEINMREFVYPALQAYDSVAMQVDLEIGGSDQTFNMLMGRKLVKEILHKEKFVLTTPLLTDASGKKIGKTEGNVIALTAKPGEFFAMVMSLPDKIILKGFTYLTELPLKEISLIRSSLKKGENPIKYKKQLAFTLTKMLHNDNMAKAAMLEFEKVHQEGKTPNNIIIKTVKARKIIDQMVELGLASSRSEAKRLIKQKAVKENGIVVISNQKSFKSSATISVGKRKWVKIK